MAKVRHEPKHPPELVSEEWEERHSPFHLVLGFFCLFFFSPNTLIPSFQCDISGFEIADKNQSNNWEKEEIQAAEGAP